MAIAVVLDGTTYYIPEEGETNYVPGASGLNAFLQALVTSNNSRVSDLLLKLDKAGSVSAPSGTTTLTYLSNRLQILTPSTAIDLNLPTTSVILGDQFWIVNTTANAVTIKSSGGNTVKVLYKGMVRLVANTATPTTSGHWTVAETEFALTEAAITSTSSMVTLTAASAKKQVITPGAGLDVALPSTNIASGEIWEVTSTGTSYTSTVKAGSDVVKKLLGATVTLVSLQATPTTSAHWAILNYYCPVGTINSAPAGGATITLVEGDNRVWSFTPSGDNAIALLPSAGVKNGEVWKIINLSTTYKLLVQAGAGGSGNVKVIVNQTIEVMAIQDTPTTNTHWKILSLYDIPEATVTAPSGNVTLDRTYRKKQLMTPSADIIVTLPTTSIYAGEEWVIHNNGAKVITLKSANADVIGYIQKDGRASCFARIDTPDAATDWGVDIFNKEKTYLHGVTYNGVLLEFTSASTGFSVTNGYCVPYQTMDGQWWVRGKLQATQTNLGGGTTQTVSLSGISIVGYAPFYATNMTGACYASSAEFYITYGVADYTNCWLSFDFPLTAKPTWAD